MEQARQRVAWAGPGPGSPGHAYTTLEETLAFIERRRPPVRTLAAALAEVRGT
jgi:hypothetical protein